MLRKFWVLIGWAAAPIILILATVLYNPGLVEAGQLVVWIDGTFYTISPDGTNKTVLAETGRSLRPTASPGCFGTVRAPCWIQYGQVLQRIPQGVSRLPTLPNDFWINSAVSWSPDGRHLVYTVANTSIGRTELRLTNAASGRSQTLAANVESSTRPVWTEECKAGLDAPSCRLAYKALLPTGAKEGKIVVLAPTRKVSQSLTMPLSLAPILNWTHDNRLVYNTLDQQARLKYADDQTAVIEPLSNGQIIGISPRADYYVFQRIYVDDNWLCRLRNVFKRSGEGERCRRRGIWLSDWQNRSVEKLYDVELDSGRGGFNSGPIWSPSGNSFVIFDEGQLIHHDIAARRSEVWYTGVAYGPRIPPVFAPDGRAIAMVIGSPADTTDRESQLLVAGQGIKPVVLDLDVQQAVQIVAWVSPTVQLY